MSKILLRFGYAEKQVLPMVRLISDMGAAGGVTADRLTDLAYAIGKVLAKGRLYSVEAIRQIGSVVPIAQILKEKLGISLQVLFTTLTTFSCHSWICVHSISVSTSRVLSLSSRWILHSECISGLDKLNCNLSKV
jgi:tape measure domain-containing protein